MISSTSKFSSPFTCTSRMALSTFLVILSYLCACREIPVYHLLGMEDLVSFPALQCLILCLVLSRHKSYVNLLSECINDCKWINQNMLILNIKDICYVLRIVGMLIFFNIHFLLWNILLPWIVYKVFKGRRVIVGSYGRSMFSFVRNFQTAFQGGWTILCSHQQWVGGPTSAHPCQHLVSLFWILVILMVRKWNLNVVLICIFMMMYVLAHLGWNQNAQDWEVRDHGTGRCGVW